MILIAGNICINKNMKEKSGCIKLARTEVMKKVKQGFIPHYIWMTGTDFNHISSVKRGDLCHALAKMTMNAWVGISIHVYKSATIRRGSKKENNSALQEELEHISG